MKKIVLQLDLHDDKAKQKAMKAVSTLAGIDSIAVEMKDRKMTVVGEVDPVSVVGKLRKSWRTDILSVGPVKEPEKKEGSGAGGGGGDKKKEEGGGGGGDKKKENEKAEGGGNGAEKKKAEPKPNEQIAELVKAYQAYNPHMTTHYYVQSYEENPNSCVIG